MSLHLLPKHKQNSASLTLYILCLYGASLWLKSWLRNRSLYALRLTYLPEDEITMNLGSFVSYNVFLWRSKSSEFYKTKTNMVAVNKYNISAEGRTMAQTVGYLSLTASTRVLFQASPCGICGGRNDTLTCLSSSISVFLSMSFHQYSAHSSSS